MPQGTYPQQNVRPDQVLSTIGPTRHRRDQDQDSHWSQFGTDPQTRRHGSTTSKSTTKASEARHTSDTTAQYNNSTSTAYTIIRTSSRKPTNRTTSRHTRRRHTTSNKETTHRKSKAESRQTRQCRQDGHGEHFESWKHDTTGQPSHKSHRHKSDTMARQHEGQETSHLCEEGGYDASYH